MNAPLKFTCIGCMPQSPRRVAFYLPIFSSSKMTGLFIQNASLTDDVIKSFVRISDDLSDMIDLPHRVNAFIGNATVFVFNDGQSFNVGDLATIAPIVARSCLVDGGQSLQLEWAELYGSPDDKRASRARAAALLSDRQTTQGSSFINSMFLNSLWSNITASKNPSTPDSDLASVHEVVMLDANCDDEQIFSDRVWHKLEPMLSLNRAELRDRVISELPQDVLYAGFGVGIATKSDYVDENTLAEASRQVRRTGRQEERVAIIMSELIERPEIGEFLLTSHSDRGQLARMIIEKIRGNLRDLPDAESRERFFATLVPIMFTNSFTFGRGEVLFYLARRLWKYPSIASAIRKKMDDSQAYNVWQMRELIERTLKYGEQTSGAISEEPTLI